MPDNCQPHRDPPPVIPDHELIRWIGRGSYGDIWLARTVMGTYRAVKLVYRAAFTHDRPYDREYAGLQKFEPISRSHEGFVDILQVGHNPAEGFFYCVMELGDDQCDGQNIHPARYCPRTLKYHIASRRCLPPEECVELGLSLCRALACLHRSSLVHRDIKPSNIIFVNGTPKLVDIGLVTDIAQDASFVGTEGFVPPEGPGSPLADIYSLGKVLYEALTGKDRNDFPQLPAELGDLADPSALLEVNEVIVKACQTQSSKRYASAEAMQADLVVLQNGKSVRRLRVLEHRWRVCRNYGTLGVLLLGLAALVYSHFAHQRRVDAEARQRQVGFQLSSGAHALERGDVLQALPAFADAFRLDIDDRTPAVTHELRMESVLSVCPRLVQMWFLGKRVNWADFSPDGWRIITTLWDGPAQIWDAASARSLLPPFGSPSRLQAACFSPDGKLVASANNSLSASVLDATTQSQLHALGHPSHVHSVAFSPDGASVVTACDDKWARIWETATGRESARLGPHEAPVLHASFSPDSRRLVTASQDRTAQIWDVATRQKVALPLLHNNWVYQARFSPDGRRVVTASFDRKARVWDAATGLEIPPAMEHGDGVRSAEFSPDGSWIVTACWNGSARIWDADTHQPIKLAPDLPHGSRVMHAAFAPDGHRIVTACLDGTVRIWDLAANRMLPRERTGFFSEDGRTSLMLSNRTLQIEHASTRQAGRRQSVLPGQPIEATLSPNGLHVLVLSAGPPAQQLQVYDAGNLSPLSPAIPCTNALANTRLGEDGRSLLIYTNNLVWTHDVATGQIRSGPLAHTQPIQLARFTPDSRHLITVAYPMHGVDQTSMVRVFETETGRAVIAPLEYPTRVSQVAFSPNSRLMVVCTSDAFLTERAAYVVDLRTGALLGRPLLHQDGVLDASFSPDGQRVITASEDFTAMVWDVSSGRRIISPLKHDNQVSSVCFSHHGLWVLTVSRDRTARVWDAATGDPITPPLRHPVPPDKGRFLPDDSGVVTSKKGMVWEWDFPNRKRSLDHLDAMATILGGSAQQPEHDDPDSRQTPARLQALWQQLQIGASGEFNVSEPEIMAWHRQRADECEAAKQWFGARFHLKRLVASNPTDTNQVHRLERAQEQLEPTVRPVSTNTNVSTNR